MTLCVKRTTADVAGAPGDVGIDGRGGTLMPGLAEAPLLALHFAERRKDSLDSPFSM